MSYIAHIRTDKDGSTTVQTVAQHSRQAAEYARRCLEPAGLGQAAYLAALLHDVGKCKTQFTEYIAEGKGHRGSVNHTFAGCRMLLERFHGTGYPGGEYDDLAAELLAYAVGAHHGLFDCVDPQQQVSGFLHRLEKEGIGYEESRDGFLAHCAGWEEIDRLFAEASAEIGRACKILSNLSEENRDDDRAELAFQFGLLARLLTSAVVEGDRRDTGEFTEDLPSPFEPEDLPRF